MDNTVHDRNIKLALLWQVIGPYRYRALGIMALVLLDTALASLGIGMVLPIFQVLMNPGYENKLLFSVFPVLQQMDPSARLILLGIGTVVVFGVKAGVAMLSVTYGSDFLQKLRFHWVSCIGEHYLYGTYLRLALRKQGELLNDWFNETLASARFFQSYLNFFASSALALALVTMGLLVNWKAMLAMLGLSVLVFGLVRGRILGGSERLSKIKLQLNQEITTSMAESLANARDLKLMLAEGERLQYLKTLGRELKDVFVRATALAEVPRVLGEFLAVLFLMTFVVVGIVLTKTSPHDILPVLAFFFIAFYRFISASSTAMASRAKALHEWHSLLTVHALTRQTVQRENLESGIPLQCLDTDIQLKDLGFSYDGTHSVLSGVNVVIPKGKTTFLVGSSGAGKSTVLDLLMRLSEPTSGCIVANGRTASEFRLYDWRRCFGYVSQDAALFNGSIRMNLRLALPAATDKEIEDACRLAGADQFIRSLPGGYDAMVGDRGYTLSGGQRKRIAIARAVIGHPAVLILDEATTSFEQLLEREMLADLRSHMPELTIIQVTHRLQTADRADWIIALENGKVVASGPWHEVASSVPSLFSGTAVREA